MKLIDAIGEAAINGKPLRLSAYDVDRVYAALGWGQRILDGLNATVGETEGGNSYTSGLEEEYEGVEPAGLLMVDWDQLEDAPGHMEKLGDLLSKQSEVTVRYRRGGR